MQEHREFLLVVIYPNDPRDEDTCGVVRSAALLMEGEKLGVFPVVYGTQDVIEEEAHALEDGSDPNQFEEGYVIGSVDIGFANDSFELMAEVASHCLSIMLQGEEPEVDTVAYELAKAFDAERVSVYYELFDEDYPFDEATDVPERCKVRSYIVIYIPMIHVGDEIGFNYVVVEGESASEADLDTC